jgi:small subunit ribosomal protein S1
MSEEVHKNEEVEISAEVQATAPEAEVSEVEANAPVAEVATPEVVEAIADDAPLDLSSLEQEEEFDWEALELGVSSKKAGERKAMEEMYVKTLGPVQEHLVVNGVVMKKTDREVIVDIGSKSEGVISLNEFRYRPDLKEGDEVEVLVDRQEDKNGQLVLSHRKARQIKAWDRVNGAFETDEVVTGYVKCRTKGGMIVDVFGLEAFLPGSQIDVKPIRDYDVYVDKTMDFKIVKINHEFRNVVVSHKALIEADLEAQKRDIISKLEKGQVLEGVVKNITSYGVFIDLGGVDGLVHITDLSWSRINHPTEVVELDQRVNVVILDFDEAKTRIQLGMKQLSAHPWDQVPAELQAGDKVKGKVVVIADYGAFVEILPGVEGLIHVSEMSWSTHLRSAQDFVKVGETIETTVLSIDREDRKLSLGLKQLSTDPWADILTKYPQGSKHKGTVRNFTNFGVFVELEEGIDGLVHISDLSWNKKVKHPSEFTSIGATLDVLVLEIDVENRKLSLGHKQLEENPWESYQTLFETGAVHAGKVVEVNDKGATIIFENFGLEGYAPLRHITKEDGSNLKAGDVVDFKVLEFNADTRRILASHTQIHKEVESVRETKAKDDTQKAVKKIQNKIERATLGDIEALSQLKADLEDQE